MTRQKRPVRVAFSRNDQRLARRVFAALADKLAARDEFAECEAALTPVPRGADAMAIMAVTDGSADMAIAPFFSSSGGYDFSTLHDLNGAFDIVATKMFRVSESYCLAARADDVIAAGGRNDGEPLIGDIFATAESEKICNSAIAGMLARGGALRIAPSHGEAARQLGVAAQRSATSAIGIAAALLPESLVDGNSRFTILKRNFGGRRIDRWFLAIENARDPTVDFDRYKTTDARTRYFYRRIWRRLAATGDAVGVNVILRLKRDEDAAASADIENYLRNFGVRYDALDLPERHHHKSPPPRIIDIEFDAADFEYDPRRRLRGRVANGALKLALSRWKSRGVQIVGAIPVSEFRMAGRGSRHWLRKGAPEAVQSFGQTQFIRLSRLAIYLLIISAVAALIVFALRTGS
ncbi:MAG: hypothetical protein AAFW81_11275 [Pseudomonadota bacterium]